jgi:hypothetical protein
MAIVRKNLQPPGILNLQPGNLSGQEAEPFWAQHQVSGSATGGNVLGKGDGMRAQEPGSLHDFAGLLIVNTRGRERDSNPVAVSNESAYCRGSPMEEAWKMPEPIVNFWIGCIETNGDAVESRLFKPAGSLVL